MVFHYQDTLKSIDEFPKRDMVLSYKNGQHQHLWSHRSFVKAHYACLRNFKKSDAVVYHFFNFNRGYPTVYKKLRWQKDPLNLLRRLFYNHSNHNGIWTLLLHQNGNYAINFKGTGSNKVWNDLKENKNWEYHQTNFSKRYHALNPELKTAEDSQILEELN